MKILKGNTYYVSDVGVAQASRGEILGVAVGTKEGIHSFENGTRIIKWKYL